MATSWPKANLFGALLSACIEFVVSLSIFIALVKGPSYLVYYPFRCTYIVASLVHFIFTGVVIYGLLKKELEYIKIWTKFSYCSFVVYPIIIFANCLEAYLRADFYISSVIFGTTIGLMGMHVFCYIIIGSYLDHLMYGNIEDMT